ncbi:MAG: phage distal tail protein, Rcc01695 family [Beijerinckiaceae bacterium]
MPLDFHDVRFPTSVALESRGGPTRRTEIVTLGSGREQRNARWAHGRRRYEAGYGVKTLDALHEIIIFFEERRGRLYGFRWKDRMDYKSCPPSHMPAPLDQPIGTGDGTRTQFQLTKTYGAQHAPYIRPISKPVAGTVQIAVAGVAQASGTAWILNSETGVVIFQTGFIPPAGAAVTAGYEFDVPVRFDTDELDIDLSAFNAGAAPKIPLVEIVV